jgi:hypothetical protein
VTRPRGREARALLDGALRDATWNGTTRSYLPRPQARADDGHRHRRTLVDAVSRPTPPCVPMDFGMGIDGFPAVSMTQFAARHYTK